LRNQEISYSNPSKSGYIQKRNFRKKTPLSKTSFPTSNQISPGQSKSKASEELKKIDSVVDQAMSKGEEEMKLL